ncbi:MAG: peptide deformylase [Solobacterium sp.]|nr:peptide deformylase [Erysipelotrichaceae bacterium]MBQ9153607.1 peptide deformylase [Solobacterium sp.]
MLINNDTILKDNDPFIREKSQPVPLPLSDEDRQILTDMYNYVKDSTDPEKAEKMNLRPAVGISAIQIGIPKQLTAVIVPTADAEGNESTVEFMLANPRIISSSVQPAYLEGGEGCLSVTEDHEGYVVRSARIKVQAYDALTDQNIVIRARGYLAIVLQHEIDHFSGILFYDRINKEEPFREVEGAMVI